MVSAWFVLLTFPVLCVKVAARQHTVTVLWERAVGMFAVMIGCSLLWMWYFHRKEHGAESGSSAVSSTLAGFSEKWHGLTSNRVFSSSGMGVLLAVGVALAGREAVDRLLGLPGAVDRTLPVLLGAMPVIMPLTACSLSMEGKSWWMTQTLPVSRRELIWSKVNLQLIVALPFYLVSEAALIVALRPGLAEAVCLLAVPAAYILFGARAGIAVNEKFPVFDWDSEVKVVKQGASAFVMVVIGLVSAAVPIIALFVLEGKAVFVYGATVGALLLLTWLLDLGGKKPCPPYRLD